MKIVKMIDSANFLLLTYGMYTKKLLKKIDDPYLRALVILSYKDGDLKEAYDLLVKTKDLYYEALSKKYTEEAYFLFQKANKLYKEIEDKVIERILNLVRIYALFLAKSKLQQIF